MLNNIRNRESDFNFTFKLKIKLIGQRFRFRWYKIWGLDHKNISYQSIGRNNRKISDPRSLDLNFPFHRECNWNILFPDFAWNWRCTENILLLMDEVKVSDAIIVCMDYVVRKLINILMFNTFIKVYIQETLTYCIH